jgi:serine/threonine-protein kinase
MICPRCTIGEITDQSGHCALCGFAPVAGVTVQRPVADEVLETVQRELEGKFRIRVLLRHGQRTIVYLAEDVTSSQLVALKVIPLQRGMQPDLARFEREAVLAASLSHSHIAPVLEFGSTRAMLWYSMEHVKGRSLADMLRESGKLSLDACRGILEQVASALDYMHRRGVTHGNLKPSNILLDESSWARVSDPCVMNALTFSGSSGNRRVTAGTPEYMAPEQFAHRAAGAGVDQYALAVIAYECLSDGLPFIGDAPDELARMHQNDKPRPLAEALRDIPIHSSDAVQRALSKVPADRFPSVLAWICSCPRAGQPAHRTCL